MVTLINTPFTVYLCTGDTWAQDWENPDYCGQTFLAQDAVTCCPVCGNSEIEERGMETVTVHVERSLSGDSR